MLGGRGGESVLSPLQITARLRYGSHQTRVNSFSVQRSLSHVSRTEESVCNDCDQETLKSGTACRVISTMMPREPRERSAARKSCGFLVAEHVTSCELDNRIVREVMDSEIKPCLRLDP